MSKMNYGFCIEMYNDDTSIETLVTGDGRTHFLSMVHNEGNGVSLGIAYGKDEGRALGSSEKYPENTLPIDIGLDIKWQIKFENVKSIDALIASLNCAKKDLIDQQS